MAKGLEEPLPTALGALASAMCTGLNQGTFGKGGGSYNWRQIIDAQREPALAFLLKAVESANRELTLRPAASALVPSSRPKPIFLVVICPRGRPEGEVRRLADKDMLYFIMAPNALAEGVSMLRLK
jgi:hypothetical protein